MQRYIWKMLACVFLLALASLPSQAGGILPGHYAYYLLVYGNAEAAYAAGCLDWHWQERAWYNHCSVYSYGPAVVVAKD
jgi:hypothetical protein